MMRGFVVRPPQSSSTAVRPVHTDNDLLDLGHAVTLSPTGFSGSMCNAADPCQAAHVHTCGPGRSGARLIEALTNLERSSTTKSLRVTKPGNCPRGTPDGREILLHYVRCEKKLLHVCQTESRGKLQACGQRSIKGLRSVAGSRFGYPVRSTCCRASPTARHARSNTDQVAGEANRHRSGEAYLDYCRDRTRLGYCTNRAGRPPRGWTLAAGLQRQSATRAPGIAHRPRQAQGTFLNTALLQAQRAFIPHMRCDRLKAQSAHGESDCPGVHVTRRLHRRHK